jgi:tetratricopeptide (TPR) repeat protein
VIRRALAAPEERYQKWVLNLWGIVLYQESDRDGAIAKFREALEIDPSFASPLFNWGVVLARQGKLEEAESKFEAVVKGWKRGDPKDTLAAAYTEWGFTLALLGHTDQAYAKFEDAVAADSSFSDVYSSWAEVLSAKGHPEEAQKMTARAVELAPVEKVYTENLIGRIQSLPAVAAVR